MQDDFTAWEAEAKTLTVAEAAAAGWGVVPPGKQYTKSEVSEMLGIPVEDLKYEVYDKGTVQMYEMLQNDPWFQGLVGGAE